MIFEEQQLFNGHCKTLCLLRLFIDIALDSAIIIGTHLKNEKKPILYKLLLANFQECQCKLRDMSER